ncbi:hypothetical protein BJ878DRAFT_80794 [Calycina marina]|uniref:Uncharacterized protein n=1 Tax=Calycina marina TaxID=1763456 RepID=A0A9P8CG91_9HELO|nr:hypothetical protein BJ878DRAFT_80794 [Calycina marina]
MAETTSATATIIQGAEHLVIEEVKIIGSRLVAKNSAEIKSIVNGVAKEALAATDDNSSTMLENIEDGVVAVGSQIVHGAVAVVEAVEKHPELLAEGALAIGIGVASIVQPELIVGSVAMIGKMAADAAKETVNEIVVESSTEVIKRVSKDIADETAELAAQDAAEKAKAAALDDANKSSSGKEATVDVEAFSSVTTEAVPKNGGSEGIKVLTTVVGEATAIVREALPDSKDGPVQGPMISKETVQTSASATSEMQPNSDTVTTEGPAVMVTTNDLTGEARVAVQKDSTTAVVDNSKVEDKLVSLAIVDIQALAKEVAKQMSALEAKKPPKDEGADDNKRYIGLEIEDSEAAGANTDDIKFEDIKTVAKSVDDQKSHDTETEELAKPIKLEENSLKEEEEKTAKEGSIKVEINDAQDSIDTEDNSNIKLEDTESEDKKADIEPTPEVKPEIEAATQSQADQQPSDGMTGSGVIQKELSDTGDQSPVQSINPRETTNAIGSSNQGQEPTKNDETMASKLKVLPGLWTKPASPAEFVHIEDISGGNGKLAHASHELPAVPDKLELTDAMMSTSQALAAILGNAASATNESAIKEPVIKVPDEVKSALPNVDSIVPPTAVANPSVKDSSEPAVAELKPAVEASAVSHVTIEQHAATHAAVIEAQERIVVLDSSNELLHQKLDAMQVALEAISQTLAERAPTAATKLAEPISTENNQIVLASPLAPGSIAAVNKRMSVFGSIGWLLGVGGSKSKGHKRGKSVATSTPASVSSASRV